MAPLRDRPDYEHQFLTSFAYSTNEYQTGKIRIPPGRVTNAIRVKGDRVYYIRLPRIRWSLSFRKPSKPWLGRKGTGCSCRRRRDSPI